MDKKSRETTKLCVKILNSERQVKGKHVSGHSAIYTIFTVTWGCAFSLE